MARFGFRSGSFRDLTIEDTARALKDLGYDSVEVCLESGDVRPETMTRDRCREIRASLDAIGIDIASVSYHGDNEEYVGRAANQTRAVEIAGWLGTGIAVLNAERTSDQPRQWAEHIARFRALADLAGRVGVTVAIEPEPLLVIGSSAEARDFLAAVDSPHLGINLDIGHAAVTDPDVAAAIRDLGKTIVHLHLEDIKGRVHRHLFFGEGDIDFAACRVALAEIGYDGPYVADLFGFAGTPLAAAERGLAGMREYFG